MGHELLEQVIDVVNRTQWPDVPFINAKSQQIYEAGMDILNLYRGHPQVLLDALKTFYQTGAQPYAYAGVAGVLISASYSHDEIYDAQGLAEAQRWLEGAQSIVGDRVEINVLEALLYLNLKQFENARLVLDHFQHENYEHFLIALTEMHYWARKRDIQQLYEWYRRAAVLATTKPRKIVITSALAGCYLTNRCFPQALQAYKLLAQLDPQDPWLWHNASIAHFHLQQYRDAEKCNKKALEFMDFKAARDMEQLIKKKRPAGWFS
jgi:tetratricopeptide (TPR) repeat protein